MPAAIVQPFPNDREESPFTVLPSVMDTASLKVMVTVSTVPLPSTSAVVAVMVGMAANTCPIELKEESIITKTSHHDMILRNFLRIEPFIEKKVKRYKILERELWRE